MYGESALPHQVSALSSHQFIHIIFHIQHDILLVLPLDLCFFLSFPYLISHLTGAHHPLGGIATLRALVLTHIPLVGDKGITTTID